MLTMDEAESLLVLISDYRDAILAAEYATRFDEYDKRNNLERETERADTQRKENEAHLRICRMLADLTKPKPDNDIPF